MMSVDEKMTLTLNQKYEDFQNQNQNLQRKLKVLEIKAEEEDQLQ
jgi:hypothetical protein